MDYSNKLKSAMEQIKGILKDNDIAGFVVLHDQTGHSEYLNAISPSYSCAKFEGQNVRFTAKASELGKDKAYKMQNDTYNMVTHFSDIIGRNALNYFQMKEQLQKLLGGTDGDSRHSSHDQQNN